MLLPVSLNPFGSGSNADDALSNSSAASESHSIRSNPYVSVESESRFKSSSMMLRITS